MNKSEQNQSSSAQAGSVRGKQEPIVDQARHALTNVAGQAREQVTHHMDVRKERAVEKISDVAGAIRETSEKLDGMGPLGDVAGRAADGIERLAQFFEGKQVTDIVRDVERFARREPAIFLGAAFAAGLIGGRFLKSSARREESASFGGGRRTGDDAWDDPGSYGDGFLSSQDLEDYESRRFGGERFDTGGGGERFDTSSSGDRDTIPTGSRGAQGSSTYGGTSGASSSSIGSSSRSGESSSYTSSARVESEGPAIPPTPIVNAASANEKQTAPMPATQARRCSIRSRRTRSRRRSSRSGWGGSS